MGLQRQEIEIARNSQTSIVREVFVHEIPILRLIHGEDEVVARGEPEDVEDEINLADEWQRLVARYHKKDKIPVFDVYGRDPKGLAAVIGIKLAANVKPRDVEAPMAKRRKKAKKAAVKASKGM
jgi:hypothetical protein